MKTLEKIIRCLTATIKKNFFKSSGAVLNQDCESLLNESFPGNDNQEVQEYLSTYKGTTRWQTI